jgi:hypothetical protein
MTNTNDTHKCTAQVPDGGRSFRTHSCGKGARFHEDVRAYWEKRREGSEPRMEWRCGTHAPSQIEARNEKKRAEQMAAAQRRDLAQRAMTARKDLVIQALGLEETQYEVHVEYRDGGMTGNLVLGRGAVARLLALLQKEGE